MVQLLLVQLVHIQHTHPTASLALAIIQRLKPRKFKDVHLNKSPMSALNNDGVSRLVVSQIVARLYTQHQDRGLLSVMLLPISGFKIII